MWFGLIKSQSGRASGLKICLFSLYGSPSTGTTISYPGSYLGNIGVPQRVSISISQIEGSPDICLFYNEDEFEDVVNKQCSEPTSMFAIDTAAREYIYSITNRHPGTVNSLLKYIFNVCTSCIIYC